VRVIAVEFLRISRFVFNIKETLEDSNSIGVRTPGVVRYDAFASDDRGRRDIENIEQYSADIGETRLWKELARDALGQYGTLGARLDPIFHMEDYGCSPRPPAPERGASSGTVGAGAL
jgi:hypothetical protein